MIDPEELRVYYRAELGKKSPDEIRAEITRLEAEAKTASKAEQRADIADRLWIANQVLTVKTDGKREGDAVRGGRLFDRPKNDEWAFQGGTGSKKTTIVPGTNGELDPRTNAPTSKPGLFPPNPFLPKVDLKTGEGLDVTPKTEPPATPKLEGLWGQPATDPAPDHYDDGHAWGWRLKKDKKVKKDKIPDAKKTKASPRKPVKKAPPTTTAVTPPPAGTFATVGTDGVPPAGAAAPEARPATPGPSHTRTIDELRGLVTSEESANPKLRDQLPPSGTFTDRGEPAPAAGGAMVTRAQIPSGERGIGIGVTKADDPEPTDPADDAVADGYPEQPEEDPRDVADDGDDDLEPVDGQQLTPSDVVPVDGQRMTATEQPVPPPYDITKDLTPEQPATRATPSSEFGPIERQRASARGCLMALLWLDDADDDELPAPAWVLRAAVVGFLVIIGVVGWLALGRTQVGSAVSPSAPTVRLRSLTATDLPRVVIQPSQAPTGMSPQSDSGPKTLQTGWRDLPAIQQALSDDGFNASYVEHFGLPTVSDGQVVSRVTTFNDPAGPTKAIGTLAKLQGTVANVQPSPAPSVATDAQTVQAQVNGFALYAFYWTRGNALLDVLVQGRQANVSADQARSLVDKMNANYDAVTSAPASSPVASSASGPCDPAPDVALTFSGSTSGTATKGCLPIGRPGPSAAPYCRLDGIPAKVGANAGVLDARIAFTLNATRWDLNITYTATTRDPNGGTLPVTLRSGAGARATLIANQTGTSSGTFFNMTGGQYTIDADGSTGTIDADFTSTSGLPVHVSGAWKVAGGCPRTG